MLLLLLDMWWQVELFDSSSSAVSLSFVIGAKEFGSGLAGGCSPEMEIVSRREKLSLEREREGNVKVAGLSYWCCLHKKNAMEYDSRIFQRIKKRKLE
jgi:hypothetical protein